MMKYKEPDMEMLYVGEFDVVTLSNQGEPGGQEGEYFDPDEWL